MKTRRKKQTKRVLASALAALVAVSAVPVSNSVVHAEESQDRSELKLRYTSAAPDSYAGWEKWSLPIRSEERRVGNRGKCIWWCADRAYSVE